MLDNELKSFRPWFAHYYGLIRICVCTAHKYREKHDPENSFSLMDSALELIDDLLAMAYEMDNGENMNQGKFGLGPQVSWELGNIRCVPDYARKHGMSVDTNCKHCNHKHCSTICRTCKLHICLGDCFEAHQRYKRNVKRTHLDYMMLGADV